jgi:hypothetical protein
VPRLPWQAPAAHRWVLSRHCEENRDEGNLIMTVISQMLDTHPHGAGTIDRSKLVECIEACLECGQACTACADACLGEDMVAELTTCIRTDLDCSDICLVTANILSRQTGFDASTAKAVLEACRAVCGSCASECESHSEMHEHCRVCAEACRRCERACAELLSSLG